MQAMSVNEITKVAVSVLAFQEIFCKVTDFISCQLTAKMIWGITNIRRLRSENCQNATSCRV